MAEALVQVEGLSFTHWQGRHGQPILHDLTLQLNRGEVVVLTGPSGSGKSTLLTIIGGLRSATEGRVSVLDTQVIGAPERALVALRRRIGFIFQQHNLAGALSVAQNIRMGLQLSGGHRSKDAAGRISTIAGRLELDEHLHKAPNQLSGGQQQRVGIARALVNQPQLVLADEPTASLDRQAGELVMDLFNELADQGSAIVLVTHDKRIIDKSDRILSLEEGRLVPPADRLIRETSTSLRTLQQVDPERLGRMMNFAHGLARVALADGRLDERERQEMARILAGRQVFSGAEIDLVVDLALSQAQAWSRTSADPQARQSLADALQAVAAADRQVTEDEKRVISELLRPPG